MSTSQTSFTCTDLGNNNVTLTVTDNNGNSSACSAVVTVEDAIAPVADCQAMTIDLDGNGWAVVPPTGIDGGSSDNCGITTMLADPDSLNSVGDHHVDLIVFDSTGNSDTCTAVVTVVDNSPPVAVCKPDTIYLNNAGQSTLTGAQIDGGSFDNGSIVGLVPSQTNFTCNHLGMNNVALSVTDGGGNTDICLAVVTVLDTISPVAICQRDTINMGNNGNPSWAMVYPADLDGGSTDNCASTTYTASIDSLNAVGDYPVTLYVTDGSGNVDSCETTVTVTDNSPPVAVCQPITIYLDGSGGASIVASDLDGGSTDNGAITSLFASQTSFDCSNLGANSDTLFVTDNGGNVDSCSSIVTVLDSITPVAICQPDTIHLGNNGAPSWAVVSPADLNGGSTDNCTTTTYTASIDSLNAVGDYPVTLFVADASGNLDSCHSTITVIDEDPPVAVCSDTATYLDGSGNASITADMIDGGSFDYGAIAGISASQLDFSCEHIGTNSDTLFVTDEGGNTSFCVATITVLDTIAPVASCQSITVALDSTGTAVLNGVMFNNGSSDNCSMGGITYTVDIADPTSVGTYSVVNTATDASGNNSICSSTLTVIDSIVPEAICRDATIYLDVSGNASITPDMIDGGSSDNGTIDNISASQLNFDCWDIGANSDTLFVTDQGGNTSLCVATVTALDTIAPTVICQGISVVLDSSGTAMIDPTVLDNGSSDNCGIRTFSTSDSSFTDVGSYTVVLTVTDSSGNASTCTTAVTVNDSIAPVAICEPDTIYLDGSGSASISAMDIDGGSSDNDTIVSYTASQTSFDCDNIGINAVTLTVTDAGGNSDSCQTIVTVMDTIAPAIVCQGITVQLDSSGVAVTTATDMDGGSTDNCGTGTLTYSASDSSFNAVGIYTVTLTVTDASGNSNICDATVTVADSEPPMAVCQPETIYLDNTGQASITAMDIDGGSTDNDTIVNYTASQTSFDCSNIGDNNITLVVSDAGGNADNCTAMVTVLDTIAPTVVCQNITVTLPDSGQVVVTGAQLNNGSTDNCGSAPLIFTASDTLFEHVGSFPDTLVVTDASGNRSYCISTVTVTDLIAPVAVCQSDTIYLDDNGQASIVPADIDGGSTDNGSIVSMTASQTSFNCSHLGNNNVTLIVTDEAGNNAFCTAVVTVLDTISPTAICQALTVPQSSNGYVVVTGDMIDGGSTDNCGGSITFTISPDTLPGTGIHSVTLTVTDQSGNSSTCESTVTIDDSAAPEAVCQPITVYVDATGNVTITGEDIDGGSTDNDTIVSYDASPSTYNCGNLGLNTSVLTVTDASGNTDLCVANVTVLDSIAPRVICQDITVPIGADGTATITAGQIDGGTTDNCTGALTYAASQTYFPGTGTYPDTLTVTDPSGNVSYCVATVTVNDDTAPITICQDTTIYLDNNGNASINDSDLDGGTTDHGGTVIFTASQTVFDCGDLGSNPVVLTATDAFGNEGSCTALVTVLDTIAPVATCKDIDVVMDFYGNATIEGIDIDGGSYDNCGAGDLNYTTDIIEFHEEGIFAVTLTVTDASGNSSTCSSQVSVAQPVKPLKIPSGFSPNGDGIADTWEIQGLREFPDNSVLIFNRWGAKIFEAKPYLNDWDGQTTTGSLPGKLPAGTYFYQLDLGSGDLRTGYIQMNR